jgi:hypothetical protein
MRVAEDLADTVLRNDGSMEQFQRRIDELLADVVTAQPVESFDSGRSPSELFRSLGALSRIGRAATCDEIAAETAKTGIPVRRYNTNRALKSAPELATRIERSQHDLLRYDLTARGRAFLEFLKVRSPHPSRPT